MRRAARKDDNHNEIQAALEAIGVGVRDMSMVGDGFSDLLTFYRGVVRLVEIKDGSKFKCRQKLTDDQVKFHQWCAAFGVTVHVVTNVHEAIAIFHGAIQ